MNTAIDITPKLDSTTSDDALIVAITDGRRVAMDILYRRHAKTLRLAALTVLGKNDGTIAADAVQDVFVALAEGRAATFRPGSGHALAWLKAIACAAALEHAGRRTAPRLKRVKKKGGES